MEKEERGKICMKKALEKEKRMKISEEKKDGQSNEVFATRILFRTTKHIREILGYTWVKCHFCSRVFDPLFILKHIGKSDDCKSFYGKEFDRLKKQKIRIRMNAYRENKYWPNIRLQEHIKQARKKSQENPITLNNEKNQSQSVQIFHGQGARISYPYSS